jgi:hypothetical protein
MESELPIGHYIGKWQCSGAKSYRMEVCDATGETVKVDVKLKGDWR